MQEKNDYPPELKEFAGSLMFYSTAAYEFVRSKFKGLPHPETVKKWFRKFNFKPGISKDILIALKNEVESYKNQNKDLIFGLQVDEMHIKKSIEFDGNVFYGFVDIGKGASDKSEEATMALVYMLVALNGHIKSPIAYYFINGLTAKERANITKEILSSLYDYGIPNVCTLTFDGTSVNISMAEQLGAKFSNFKDEVFFKHPNTGHLIYIILDACHMIKLIRNALAESRLFDKNGQEISWKYLQKLVELQDLEGLHCGTRIRKRHMRFEKEKMKVKLAAQTCSRSVSEALLYLKNKKLVDFKDAGPTAEFCRNFNDIFDFLNVRSSFSNSETLKPITPKNIDEWDKKVEEWISYIETLKILPKKNDSIIVDVNETKQEIKNISVKNSDFDNNNLKNVNLRNLNLVSANKNSTLHYSKNKNFFTEANQVSLTSNNIRTKNARSISNNLSNVNVNINNDSKLYSRNNEKFSSHSPKSPLIPNILRDKNLNIIDHNLKNVNAVKKNNNIKYIYKPLYYNNDIKIDNVSSRELQVPLVTNPIVNNFSTTRNENNTITCTNNNVVFHKNYENFSNVTDIISKKNCDQLCNILKDSKDKKKKAKTKDNTNPVCVLQSQRKTGFMGFIISMKSSLKIARELIEKKKISYFLTYKLSQDHIETLFSIIRRKNGFNNNPSCKQFEIAYRNIATHVHSLVSQSANCVMLDNTRTLQLTQNNGKNQKIVHEDVHNFQNNILNNNDNIFHFDHDYEASNVSVWSEYKDDIIAYIAGSLVRKLRKEIESKDNCQFCLAAIVSQEEPTSLQIQKERGTSKTFLTTPHEDVVRICKCTEKVIRSIPNLLKIPKAVSVIKIATVQKLPRNIFTSLDALDILNVKNNHKNNLISTIIEKYAKLRLYHETALLKDNVYRCRSRCNRTVIFKNQ